MTTTPLLTSPPSPASRNNFTGSVGYRFRAVRNMTIVALGRYKGSVFANSHTIRLWDDVSLLLGSVTVTTSSPLDVNNWAYEMLSSSVNLVAGSFYRLVSAETNGGDNWQDASTLIGISASDIDTIAARFIVAPANFPGSVTGSAGQAFAWPNMYVDVANSSSHRRRKYQSIVGVGVA